MSRCGSCWIRARRKSGHCAHHLRMRVFRCHMIRCGFLKLASSLPSAQLDRSFHMCDACEVVGITLGAEAERLVRYYALIDMARMSVLDAMLSAWVEECCDESERQIITETRTARLCPGYGDIPLALNEPLGAALSLPRIGLYVKAGGALFPAEIDDRTDRHRGCWATQKLRFMHPQ